MKIRHVTDVRGRRHFLGVNSDGSMSENDQKLYDRVMKGSSGKMPNLTKTRVRLLGLLKSGRFQTVGELVSSLSRAKTSTLACRKDR